MAFKKTPPSDIQDLMSDTINGLPREMYEDGLLTNDQLAKTVAEAERRMYDQLSKQIELERQKYLNALNQASAMGTKSSFPSTTNTVSGTPGTPYFDPLQSNPYFIPSQWPSTTPMPTSIRINPAPPPAYVFMPAGSLVKCHSGHVCGSLVRQAHFHNLHADDIDWVEGTELSMTTKACPVCHSTSFMIDNEHFRSQLLSTMAEMMENAGLPEAAAIIKEMK